MNIINKIFAEESVIKNSNYKIVEDKYPICDGHILAFSLDRKKSALDDNLNNLNELFKNVKSYFGESFYFYERGNASFCTSINGPICSHIHFFPKTHFKSNMISDLNKTLKLEKLNSFLDRKNIRSEYFIIGDEHEINFIELKSSPPKRYLRNYFIKNIL